MDDNLKKWLNLYDKDRLEAILGYILDVDDLGYRIQPAIDDVFKAFKLCPIGDLKVVIVGQDPYPMVDVATGIAFANKRGTKVLSPSLQVIKDSVISPYSPSEGKIFDETLESWAKQGVLLLNGALTTIKDYSGAHLDVWRGLTEGFLYNLSRSKLGIVYVLLGAYAKSFNKVILERSNVVIRDNHPEYYCRTDPSYRYTFFDSINAILKHRYEEYINWYESI